MPTIIEMVNDTRLDCVIGSAAAMRQAVAQAIHHAAHRSAFGKPLIDQPLMQNVLADLAIESEAATLPRAPRARLRRGGAPATRPRRLRASPPRCLEVLDLQARAGARPRRSSASAATATSRSRACRGSTASRR